MNRVWFKAQWIGDTLTIATKTDLLSNPNYTLFSVLNGLNLDIKSKTIFWKIFLKWAFYSLE